MPAETIAQYKQLSKEAYKKSSQKDPAMYQSPFNLGFETYNEWVENDTKISDNRITLQNINKDLALIKDPKKKAAEQAKKQPEINRIKAENADLDKKQVALANEGIEWMEKAYTILAAKANRKNEEKRVIGGTVDYLSNLYGYLRDKNKANQAEYNKYDAKYKLYDNLHGTFK